MSDGLSVTQAIKAVYTVDTIIHGQMRLLPLRMDKEYQTAKSKLKRLEKQDSLKPASVSDVSDVSDESEIEDANTDETQIQKLKSVVKRKQDETKRNTQICLPDTRTARRNHYII